MGVKKRVRLWGLFCFLLSANCLSALTISEIHFDPPGSDADREWIEIFNNTSSTIDLTEIKFFEANVNHGISLFNQLNSTDKDILPGEYVVVAQNYNKFLSDFPNYTGKIFKASFSLSNSGETLALKDKSGVVLFSISYTEADKQLIPSPGQPNSGGTVGSTPTSSNSTSTSSTSTSPGNTTQVQDVVINYIYRSYWPESEKIYVKAGENRIVMQGQEVIFSPRVLDSNKREIRSGLQYRWSFGDGYTSEKREGLHTFKFTGEFVVNLQVNYNGLVEEDKVYIKVVEPKLGIKIAEQLVDVGTSSQKILVDVVAIQNENKFELNLGGLQVVNEQGKVFTLPDKLIVLGGRSIYLSPELTGFSNFIERVGLRLANGRILAEASKPTTPKPVAVATTTVMVSTNTIQVFTPEQFMKMQIHKETFSSDVPKPKFQESNTQNYENLVPARKPDLARVHKKPAPPSIVESKSTFKVTTDASQVSERDHIEFKPQPSGFWEKFLSIWR